METRMIKTCHGLQVVKFHDGALLPPDISPDAEIRTWWVPQERLVYPPEPRLSPKEIKKLYEMIKRGAKTFPSQ